MLRVALIFSLLLFYHINSVAAAAVQEGMLQLTCDDLLPRNRWVAKPTFGRGNDIWAAPQPRAFPGKSRRDLQLWFAVQDGKAQNPVIATCWDLPGQVFIGSILEQRPKNDALAVAVDIDIGSETPWLLGGRIIVDFELKKETSATLVGDYICEGYASKKPAEMARQHGLVTRVEPARIIDADTEGALHGRVLPLAEWNKRTGLPTRLFRVSSQRLAASFAANQNNKDQETWSLLAAHMNGDQAALAQIRTRFAQQTGDLFYETLFVLALVAAADENGEHRAALQPMVDSLAPAIARRQLLQAKSKGIRQWLTKPLLTVSDSHTAALRASMLLLLLSDQEFAQQHHSDVIRLRWWLQRWVDEAMGQGAIAPDRSASFAVALIKLIASIDDGIHFPLSAKMLAWLQANPEPRWAPHRAAFLGSDSAEPLLAVLAALHQELGLKTTTPPASEIAVALEDRKLGAWLLRGDQQAESGILSLYAGRAPGLHEWAGALAWRAQGRGWIAAAATTPWPRDGVSSLVVGGDQRLQEMGPQLPAIGGSRNRAEAWAQGGGSVSVRTPVWVDPNGLRGTGALTASGGNHVRTVATTGSGQHAVAIVLDEAYGFGKRPLMYRWLLDLQPQDKVTVSGMGFTIRAANGLHCHGRAVHPGSVALRYVPASKGIPAAIEVWPQGLPDDAMDSSVETMDPFDGALDDPSLPELNRQTADEAQARGVYASTMRQRLRHSITSIKQGAGDRSGRAANTVVLVLSHGSKPAVIDFPADGPIAFSVNKIGVTLHDQLIRMGGEP